ncbi:MAG: 16S rRNA (cytidine(1402)-2'-O)-methyltransferase [Candidatus Dojkabacteria bacterium]
MSAKLIFLGTTIGNIDDISIRAIKTIFSTEVIFAEDTRVFLKLKNILKERYSDIIKMLSLDVDFKNKLFSYREQNHSRAIKQITEFLLDDKDVVYCSDAGMPGISDPGARISAEVIQMGIEIDVVSGPTAVISALLMSALPIDKFSFLGFLPKKEGKIVKLLEKYLVEETTVVFYESPHRVFKVCEIIIKNLGHGIEVAAVTEISKLHQKVFRGEISDVIYELLHYTELKGEWTVCLRRIS